MKLRKEVFDLKKILVLSLLILLSGCLLNTSQPDYFVLVVEGEENLIKTFDEHATVKNPYMKIDYYKSVEVAKNDFSDYELEELPIVYIFSVNGDKSMKLLLRTNDINEAIPYLGFLKNKK